MSVTVALRASGIGQQFEEPSDEGRVLSQARRTLFVEAANQPILHHQINAAEQEITGWMAPLLTELGSIEPPRDVHHLLALTDADRQPADHLAAGLRSHRRHRPLAGSHRRFLVASATVNR
jgi:Tetracyclin repressor-like, C-terminal domain